MSLLNSSRGQSISNAYTSNTVSNSMYQTNNKFAKFPPIMNDGRSVLASWQPGAVVNDILMKESGIQSNWQYRKFLMENADHIRQQNFRFACNDSGYFVRNSDMNVDPSNIFGNPAFYASVDEPIKHIGAEPSDLKQTYLSRLQLDSRRVIPTMTQDELIKRWGNMIHK